MEHNSLDYIYTVLSPVFEINMENDPNMFALNTPATLSIRAGIPEPLNPQHDVCLAVLNKDS